MKRIESIPVCNRIDHDPPSLDGLILHESDDLSDEPTEDNSMIGRKRVKVLKKSGSNRSPTKRFKKDERQVPKED